MMYSRMSKEDQLAVLLTVLEHVHEGVYCVDNDRRIFYWNEAATKITGYTADEMVGKRCFETRIKHVDIAGKNLCAAMCPLVATMFDGRIRSEPVYAHCKDGRVVEVVVNSYPLLVDDRTVGAIEIFTQKAAVDAHQTFLRHGRDENADASGLPNSDYVNYFIDMKVQEKRRFDTPFVIELVRIDNFDEIQKNRGEEEAEKILRELADKIKDDMRSSELLGRLKKDLLIGIYMSASARDLPVIRRHTICCVQDFEQKENLKLSIAECAATAEDTPSSLIRRACEILDS
ncbi:MAG: diguanylate cyclase [Fibrobacter sp.]|nr:diguanylate cyclase [Fibrobacter sp.]